MRLALLLWIAAALASAGVKYTYDTAGRLLTADYGNGTVILYTYDKAGNMTKRQVGGTGPVITSITVANGGPDIGQNTWIVIKGSGLVPATTPASGVIWSNAPEFQSGMLPTQLGGVSVTVNGKPAYVYFYCSAVTSTVCTADQINVLTPLDSTLGPVPVITTSSNGSSAPFSANMKADSPALLLFSGSYVAATHVNNSLLGPATLYPGLSTPAKAGEVVVVYAVGFGLPTGTLTGGSSSQSGALPTLPLCQVGGNNAPVSFAGLISPGLYQLNMMIPANAASGDNPIACTYGGAATPAGDLITVQ